MVISSVIAKFWNSSLKKLIPYLEAGEVCLGILPNTR